MSRQRDSIAAVKEQEGSPLPIRTAQEVNQQSKEAEDDGMELEDEDEDSLSPKPTNEHPIPEASKSKYCSRCKKEKGVAAFHGGFMTCSTCREYKRKGRSDNPLTARGIRELLGENPPMGLRSSTQPGDSAERRSEAGPTSNVAIAPHEPPLTAADLDFPQTFRAPPGLAEEDLEAKAIEDALTTAAQAATQKACSDLLKAEIASAEIADRVHKAAIQDADAKIREIRKQQEIDMKKAAISTRRINLLKRKLEDFA
ncbi:MAG: hypothetical protein M1835_004002 [Candelina submexicana]|nr:MAG: hypothetical protein M1835_004002 [Candelina submexicana]